MLAGSTAPERWRTGCPCCSLCPRRAPARSSTGWASRASCRGAAAPALRARPLEENDRPRSQIAVLQRQPDCLPPVRPELVEGVGRHRGRVLLELLDALERDDEVFPLHAARIAAIRRGSIGGRTDLACGQVRIRAPYASGVGR